MSLASSIFAIKAASSSSLNCFVSGSTVLSTSSETGVSGSSFSSTTGASGFCSSGAGLEPHEIKNRTVKTEKRTNNTFFIDNLTFLYFRQIVFFFKI